MVEIIECEEFGTVTIGVERLLVNGTLILDPRIVSRGYFNVSLARGELVLRADRHVGLIPLNDQIAVRVKPRTQIESLTKILVRSGIMPVAISDFSRGYQPQFERNEDTEDLYARSLIEGAERVVSHGLLKGYVAVKEPPAWRGRLLASDTIKNFRSRGIRYRSAFGFQTLTTDIDENVAIKCALQVVCRWLRENHPRDPLLARATRLLDHFRNVSDQVDMAGLVRDIPMCAINLTRYHQHYRDPLWTAYVVLQAQIPDLSSSGLVSLDSLIVDVSKIYEAYLRRVLDTVADERRWIISDGNEKPRDFFETNGLFSVHPDIVVTDQHGENVILDAKYKPEPKEGDRYELLSFMEAFKSSVGGFICPATPSSTLSRQLGRTAGGKTLSILRYDLGAQSLAFEDARLVKNVARMFDVDASFE